MMVFDLGCGEGHRFEGWFESGADFERQLREGLLSCPVCGGNRVERVPSTFGIGASSRSGGESAGEPSPAAFFKRITEFVKSNFDDVGSRFATEALKMHYGVSEPRNIRGVSTKAEEKMLKDEGVSFLKVPVIAPKDTDA